MVCSNESIAEGLRIRVGGTAQKFHPGRAKHDGLILWMVWESSMELAWGILAISGVIAGGVIMMFGFRKKEQKPAAFGHVDGVLKQDWTRTGNIDFHAAALESVDPQPLTLRVEEKKITENAMGQDIAELRWRLATLEEAKEIVVCWNARQP